MEPTFDTRYSRDLVDQPHSVQSVQEIIMNEDQSGIEVNAHEGTADRDSINSASVFKKRLIS